MKVSVDFETRSPVDIRTRGSYPYDHDGGLGYETLNRALSQDVSEPPDHQDQGRQERLMIWPAIRLLWVLSLVIAVVMIARYEAKSPGHCYLFKPTPFRYVKPDVAC